jgi:hypothetical protein
MTELDPAAIKAEHGKGYLEDYPDIPSRCLAGCGAWPCETYELARALAEAREREQGIRDLHESRPAAQLGKLSEVCWNCYPLPYPCETIRILDSTHDREAGT